MIASPQTFRRGSSRLPPAREALARLFDPRLVIRRSLPVAAPPEAVWEALIDLPRWPARDRYIRWIRPVGEPPPADGRWWAPGRRYREQVRRGPFLPVFNLTVTEVEEGRRVAWRARYLWVDAVHAWNVERGEDGAILASEETFTGPRVIMAIARAVFRLFRVEAMTDRQLGFMAADALNPPERPRPQ